MERDITIGDKVKLVRPSERTRKNRPSLSVGDEGIVVQIKKDYDVITDWMPLLYGIEWSNPITKGHDCEGNCKPGHGSYVEIEEVEKC